MALLFVLTLSACAEQAPPPELPFADSSTTTVAVADSSEPAGEPIVTENEDLIAFQARWVCELQRRTFSDLSGMDSALDDALADTGLSRPAYDEFTATMADSQALRDEVLRLYSERCRA